MILTNDFVFVHQPKTGGTFVSEVLIKIYKARSKRGLFLNLPKKVLRRIQKIALPDFIMLNKHGRCNEIPEAHRNKPIFATVRNPFDRNVSLYEYKWWKKDPFYTVQVLEKAYPHFPDISFEEYLQFLYFTVLPSQVKNVDFNGEHGFGFQTWQFVDFFFKNPEKIFPKIGPDYIASQEYKTDMFDVHFIRTDRLNQELFDFLSGVGYTQGELEFILDLSKISPPVLFPLEGGRSDEQNWEKYYTPEMKHMVRVKEDLIFTIFPEFDV